MTALTEYERLEATGLWRATAEAQRREVLVSVGEATLTIADFNNRALAHWSLAAIDRQNPGEYPAIYSPDGDPGETLELEAGEDAMIDAIERLRRAVERRRPRPGRLRLAGLLAFVAAFLALVVFWLPGALLQHTLKVVPAITRQEIGEALLDRVERIAGRTCNRAEALPALTRLARRTGARRVVVLAGGVRDTLQIPGGIILLNRALIEDHEDPAVVAGYILAERVRATLHNPFAQLLADGAPMTSFRLLTTGDLTMGMLDRYAERMLLAPRPPVPSEDLLAAFAAAEIPAAPYAYARDITGESVLGLIEADPMRGQAVPPVLRDRDWLLLQSICET